MTPADRRLLGEGTVIVAHPLALTADRRLDERRQRALTRYYLAAGAGGVAVGVHTTQFALHGTDMLERVLRLAAEECRGRRPLLRVAGVCGPTAQAVAEAELAARLGYDLALLSPVGLATWSEAALLQRTREVARVLPVFGFYLQPAVGGRSLPADYWRALADIPGVLAIKVAPFDRYATTAAAQGVGASARGEQVALYTGNDDHIVADLLTPLPVDGGRFRWMVGGLLGQWAVWTRAAVALQARVREARECPNLPAALLRLGAELTDANAAIFDAAHGFRGCIPGIHEVLRRQGLLAGRWCLDPAEDLSPGQAERIDAVSRAYPHLTDDGFVRAHLRQWLA